MKERRTQHLVLGSLLLVASVLCLPGHESLAGACLVSATVAFATAPSKGVNRG